MIFRYGASLAEHNTLGFDARAEALVEPADIASLRRALRIGRRRFATVTALGGGSNVVLKPSVPGLCVRYAGCACWIEAAAGSDLWHVEAGMNWHALVMRSAAAGWWGIENLALIPGSSGAAPIQNIGAYGVEAGDVLESVHFLHIESGRYEILTRDRCAFGYRDSIFKRALAGRVVIVRIVLRLSRQGAPRLDYGDLASRLPASDAVSPLAVAEAVCAARREKLPDPAVTPNAGSFFKNPVVPRDKARALLAVHPTMPHWQTPDGVKLAAGWLIDRCGWRGFRRQGVGVHEHQALVLVHHGGSDAEGLLALAEEVARSVEARFGVVLEREPTVIGRTAPAR